MYSISKLSSETKSFIQGLPTALQGNQEIVAYAVAKAVANELMLPSSPVDNPTEFYLHNAFIAAREGINVINEISVLDLNRVQELVKIFWFIRYNILFPRKKVFVTGSLPSESYFFGFGSLLSPKDAKFIQDNTQVLVNTFNGFSQMLVEMTETQTELGV